MHEFDWFYTLLNIGLVVGGLLSTCAVLIFVERKVAAYIQDRLGPNRVGPKGLLQPLADGLKFLFKEDIVPKHVDKVLFIIAPAIALTTALLAFVVIPFGATEPPPSPPVAGNVQAVAEYQRELETYRQSYQAVVAPGLDVGIVFLFAISSLAVYAVILGGWASNNKYSFLGALRSSAQMISYEIPLGMSILGVVLMAGSLNLETIIWSQATGGPWFFFVQPVAFLIFMISAFAECNRLPFDLAEAEQELIGGFHTEYSALKFAMFFLGEYTHMVTTSFLMAILFFGGWHFPFIAEAESFWVFKVVVLIAKAAFFILLFMVIRWTLPRFRFDQLMTLAWKVLIPLALVNLVCVMVVKEMNWSMWWLLPAMVGVLFAAAWMGTMGPTKRREALVG